MKAKRTHIAALTVVAAASLLAACERRTTTVADATPGSTSTTTTSTTVAPSPAASNAMSATANAVDKAGDAVGDAAITGKVKTVLIADADIKALQIDVDTKNGVVTLSGTADSAAHADKASADARRVDGVKAVDNKLTVKP
ncbi:MAG TPA: BON domain-containing protein [Caldimonas sp.]|jgi:hyperosmotically inducible protein|nr:BON domain-containing protein [Caldimonas sp.]